MLGRLYELCFHIIIISQILIQFVLLHIFFQYLFFLMSPSTYIASKSSQMDCSNLFLIFYYWCWTIFLFSNYVVTLLCVSQGGKGYVKNITYSRMSFVEVKNPITIDQYYCGGGSGCNTQVCQHLAFFLLSFNSFFAKSIMSNSFSTLSDKFFLGPFH